MNALASHLAAGLDPALLAERIGMRPDEWQNEVLRSTAPRLLLNCCRQSGKSTIAALLAVHTALYEPGALTLVVSPSLNQSRELFKTALVIYRTIGKPVAAESENRLSLELENGSRIVSLPGSESTIRGYANVSLLIIDEAAQVEDDLYFTVQPMLAVSGGRLIAMSTPFGRRGWWYHAWESDEPWERYELPASACTRITPEFLEQTRREVGEWWFTQEYECRFNDAATQAYGTEDIEAMFNEPVEAWAI